MDDNDCCLVLVMDFKSWRLKFLTLVFFCVIGIVHLSAIIVVTDGAGGEGIVVGVSVDEERR